MLKTKRRASVEDAPELELVGLTLHHKSGAAYRLTQLEALCLAQELKEALVEPTPPNARSIWYICSYGPPSNRFVDFSWRLKNIPRVQLHSAAADSLIRRLLLTHRVFGVHPVPKEPAP